MDRLARLVQWWGVVGLLGGLCACHDVHVAPQTQPSGDVRGLVEATPDVNVEAIVSPPEGWACKPLQHSSRHDHQLWISPTGDTAYGVIRVKMPLPIGPNLALVGFLREMRRDQGESRLLHKERASDLSGLRFVAEGGLYRLYGSLITHGFTAWVVYAGVLRERPVNYGEFALAARARDSTIIGLPRESD